MLGVQGFRVQGSGFRVQGSGLKGSGFWVQGFRVQRRRRPKKTASLIEKETLKKRIPACHA